MILFIAGVVVGVVFFFTIVAAGIYGANQMDKDLEGY